MTPRSILLAALLAASAPSAPSSPFALPAPAAQSPTAPPAAPSAHEFYTKHLDCAGIAVRSSSAVDDAALRLACGKINLMLRDIPGVRERLIRAGAEMHIIGRAQRTSDLPEFQDQRDKVYVDNTGHATTIDQRTRGKGGLLTSCGEENILHLPGDRYGDGSDICIHEFAHAIMGYGFDERQRREIAEQYARSRAAGLWPHAYAATNPQEYWAELSMWYFASHGDRRMSGAIPANGREGLHAYDPGGFALLQNLYGGGD